MAAAQPVSAFVEALASKVPTPGGGAAAAVGAAIGGAAAAMAANYSQRKKDVESGAAAAAQELIATLDLPALLASAVRATCHSSALTTAAFELLSRLLWQEADAAAYADLQRSWKDADMSADEKKRIEAVALAVPVSLVERCHAHVLAIKTFLPSCNPNITSDAKVGIHQLAGAARAAYQTALVNSPPPDVRERLRALLQELRAIEDGLLE